MSSDLAQLLRDPGFTPGRRHLPSLFLALGGDDPDTVLAVERALGRVGPSLAPDALSRLRAASSPLRGRLARLLGRIASSPGGDALRDSLLSLLGDPDLKVRRHAALALGKLPGPGVEQALLEVWASSPPVELRRSLAEALGKVGGEASLAALGRVESDDPELTRLVQRAVVMLSRGLARVEGQRIDVSRPTPGRMRVVLRCKRGIEGILLDEARGVLFHPEATPGQVRGWFEGPLLRLVRLRTATGVAFSMPPAPCDPENRAPALVAVLRAAAPIFKTFGPHPARFRVAWRDSGHLRSAVWETARLLLDEADLGLINDPSGSAWEVEASVVDRKLWVDISPRAFDDPRFAYRLADVPAASHPTVAAALARLGGVREDDIVWDPFVGSGLELCERARLGPYEAMIGTDLDPAALDAARVNLLSAEVRPFELHATDARAYRLPGVSLILSNPPMGRRVSSPEGLERILLAFVANAARHLAPGGRLAWLSPLGEQTARAAREQGLDVHRVGNVDLGGVWAEAQVFRQG